MLKPGAKNSIWVIRWVVGTQAFDLSSTATQGAHYQEAESEAEEWGLAP